MTIQAYFEIYGNGNIRLDGVPTHFYVKQCERGTRVYKAPRFSVLKMPSARYSLAHDNPDSGVAGRAQFEADLRAALAKATAVSGRRLTAPNR